MNVITGIGENRNGNNNKSLIAENTLQDVREKGIILNIIFSRYLRLVTQSLLAFLFFLLIFQ